MNHLWYVSPVLIIPSDVNYYMFYIYNEVFFIIISDMKPEREYLKLGTLPLLLRQPCLIDDLKSKMIRLKPEFINAVNHCFMKLA